MYEWGIFIAMFDYGRVGFQEPRLNMGIYCNSIAKLEKNGD
jgi:hypothetical protein